MDRFLIKVKGKSVWYLKPGHGVTEEVGKAVVYKKGDMLPIFGDNLEKVPVPVEHPEIVEKGDDLLNAATRFEFENGTSVVQSQVEYGVTVRSVWKVYRVPATRLGADGKWHTSPDDPKAGEWYTAKAAIFAFRKADEDERAAKAAAAELEAKVAEELAKLEKSPAFEKRVNEAIRAKLESLLSSLESQASVDMHKRNALPQGDKDRAFFAGRYVAGKGACVRVENLLSQVTL